jgi:hypothetical protein
MTDADRQYLEAMEARLMSRITGAQEAVTERMRTLDAGVAALIELMRSAQTLMGTAAGLMADVGRRVTDLEKKA